MPQTDIRTPWERAAPGWARWDATVAMALATKAMLVTAGVDLDAGGSTSQWCGEADVAGGPPG